MKRITSQDVADAARVSRTTVSLVLNNAPNVQISEETRHRVIAAARSLGYVPDAAARALVSRRAQIIGLVMARSHYHVASDAFLPQSLEGLLDVVHHYGVRLLIDIVEPQHQKEAYLQLVRAKHIDGLILSGPRLDDEALLPLDEENFPIVLIGRLPGDRFYSVDVDNRSSARTAVEHLIKQGHTRIACITNASPEYSAAAERLAGYREALEASGLEYDQSLVRYGDFNSRSGYQQMRQLILSGAEFTAVFAASDEVAYGVNAALVEQNMRPPEKVALVGFDDLPMSAYFDPPLTTVRVPATELARRAGNLLVQILEGDRRDQRVQLLETHLIVRHSCDMKKTALYKLED
jgi:DNA-binding LacI/PurR family transcriptional regulator